MSNTHPWATVASGHSVHVTAVQYLLRARGHTVTADGVYGPSTQSAVRTFQTAAGLTADGIVGPSTWPKLVTTTRQGDRGDAVRAVQVYGMLRHPGDTALVVDGDFGPTTADRLTFHQESWGLVSDGVAGSMTWAFLARESDAWPLVGPEAVQKENWRVLAAQHLLRHHGSSIAADGVFGPASQAAIVANQKKRRTSDIEPWVGQLDWPALIVTVKRGDDSQAVAAAQSLLYGLTRDGVFGPLTEAAVKRFQTTFAPPADGIVGPKTWHTMMLRLFD